MVVKRPGLFLRYKIKQEALLTRVTEVEYWCALYVNRRHGRFYRRCISLARTRVP